MILKEWYVEVCLYVPSETSFGKAVLIQLHNKISISGRSIVRRYLQTN